jgi:16S rRNA (cytidine1402-2'-O)-methyltransferase
MDSGIAFVTTPIGDIEDLTAKARRFLEQSQAIFCEDTRKTKDLLKRLEILYENKTFKSFHDHSAQGHLDTIIATARNELCVYVSDAGSPLISDPAFDILKRATSEDLKTYHASGISAVIYALEISGLPAIPFQFHGFIPREKSKIKAFFEGLGYGTHIFFEGVSRVESTLDILGQALPESDVVVTKELTKTFESIYRFKAKDWPQVEIDYRGEFTILVHQDQKVVSSSGLKTIALEILNKGAKPKLVAKLVAEVLDQNTKDIYNQLGKN